MEKPQVNSGQHFVGKFRVRDGSITSVVLSLFDYITCVHKKQSDGRFDSLDVVVDTRR